MKKILILFIGLLMTAWVQGQEKDLFDEATQYYAEGNYEEAIQNYQHILDQGKTSVALYYNLANSYYKTNQIGPSIYYYHKALQLSPNDKDVQNNLLFAQEKTIDAIEVLPKTGWKNFMDNLISTFNFNTWAWMAIIGSFGVLCFWVLYYFSRKTFIKRSFFTLAMISLVFGLTSLVFAYQQETIQKSKKYAIVFAEEASVHSEPNHNSAEAFFLHEGTRVKILDNFNGYSLISLTDDSRGWINETYIKEL